MISRSSRTADCCSMAVFYARFGCINTQLVTTQKWSGLQIGKMYLATGNLHLNAVILYVRRKKYLNMLFSATLMFWYDGWTTSDFPWCAKRFTSHCFFISFGSFCCCCCFVCFFCFFKIKRKRELTLLAYESRPVPTTVFSYFCVSGIHRSDWHTKLEAGPWCNAAWWVRSPAESRLATFSFHVQHPLWAVPCFCLKQEDDRAWESRDCGEECASCFAERDWWWRLISAVIGHQTPEVLFVDRSAQLQDHM